MSDKKNWKVLRKMIKENLESRLPLVTSDHLKELAIKNRFKLTELCVDSKPYIIIHNPKYKKDYYWSSNGNGFYYKVREIKWLNEEKYQ